MKIVQRSEISQILAMTPDIQENSNVIQQLQYLERELCVVRQPWTYNIVLAGANGAAANGIATNTTSAPLSVLIDASAMFEICNQTYWANSLNAAVTSGTYVVPNCTVMLVDTGSGMQMMDVPAPIPAIFGSGQFPYVLPEPKIMAANSGLQATFTNFDAAAGYNIRLCFNGYKIYSLRQPTSGIGS